MREREREREMEGIEHRMVTVNGIKMEFCKDVIHWKKKSELNV